MKSRTYRSPKRLADAEETRRRLIAAASALLSKPPKTGGFSLDAVAKKAGVTRLTVYHQFGSRRALLEAVFDSRAEQGGLYNIPVAMGDPDPYSGLMRLISIFCTFWASNHVAIARLAEAGINDSELKESLHQRNERRRSALSVLVGRLTQRGTIPASASKDVVDMLFAITGYQFYSELQCGKRDSGHVCKLIQMLAENLLVTTVPSI